MKIQAIYILLIFSFLSGFTIPCELLFKNFSKETVRLNGKLVDRWHFEKLPNKVDYYDTTWRAKQLCGEWKCQRLITWLDSASFQIDIPPFSTIDLADVSNG